MNDDEKWSELLQAYGSAITEFQAVSAALTLSILDEEPLDAAVVEAERIARQRVVDARTSFIEFWQSTKKRRPL